MEIRPIRSDEAAELVRCFERCYGKSYVVEAFYDPALIQARLASGLLRSVVAVSPADGIVGHMALTLRDPVSRTCDAGNTVVDPRYRGHALAAKMAARLVAVCRDDGFVGFHHYPTTAHPVMQKLAVAGGGIETGIMLGYIPAGTEYRELAESASHARLAVVIVYQPIANAPARQVFAPERYRALLESALRDASLTRSFGAPADVLAPHAAIVASEHDARRGLKRITVVRAGADLGARIRAEIAEPLVSLVQVDLDLGDPGAGPAVEVLRALGFYLAGVLPEYLSNDVLRLQRLAHPSAEELEPKLATAGARALLEAISSDRAM